MSNMASVSRPPSIHAPWRKSFIIPLFTIHLGFSAFVAIWHLLLYGLSIYAGSDSGQNSYTEALYATVGSFGVVSTLIIIGHVVLFARFRLTAWIFMLGNGAVTVLSLISMIIGITNEKRRYEFGYSDYLIVAFPATLCAISLVGLVYAVIVWRKVNSGRAIDMVKPGGGLGGAAKGGDVQDDANAIPMV
ncbi:hypothetical protein VF21_07367 [Pseudogymnoascus sp. 05NY08]|nr:hypothetical protein VF21_07367 [Pseudogymnoascus sp. 05NY08]